MRAPNRLQVDGWDELRLQDTAMMLVVLWSLVTTGFLIAL